MDTVHVTERITAACLCILAKWEGPLSRVFLKQASNTFANVISLPFEFFRMLFGSWLIMHKFEEI